MHASALMGALGGGEREGRGRRERRCCGHGGEEGQPEVEERADRRGPRVSEREREERKVGRRE